jgi:hypothetical protein
MISIINGCVGVAIAVIVGTSVGLVVAVYVGIGVAGIEIFASDPIFAPFVDCTGATLSILILGVAVDAANMVCVVVGFEFTSKPQADNSKAINKKKEIYTTKRI